VELQKTLKLLRQVLNVSVVFVGVFRLNVPEPLIKAIAFHYFDKDVHSLLPTTIVFENRRYIFIFDEKCTENRYVITVIYIGLD
jgi:hypothetical protein